MPLTMTPSEGGIAPRKSAWKGCENSIIASRGKKMKLDGEQDRESRLKCFEFIRRRGGGGGATASTGEVGAHALSHCVASTNQWQVEPGQSLTAEIPPHRLRSISENTQKRKSASHQNAQPTSSLAGAS